jgi:UDP-N-acetylglucosamine acyltransferase
MAYCHVAHNSTLGDRVILSNNATLAGHVTIEDSAIIGGLSAIHQFARVGRYAMVGGMSRVTHDVPPYTIGAGSPYRLGGLNLVGLRRHGFPLSSRIALAKAFKILYRLGLPLQQALQKIEDEIEPIPEIQHFIEFCRSSKRGLIADWGRDRKNQDGERDE